MKHKPSSELSKIVHRQATHCESGTVATLCTASGLPLSEPMAFGIGSGIFFSHLSFVKMMDLETTSFRSLPGTIAKKTFGRLGMNLTSQRFRRVEDGVEALDAILAQGSAVGIQVSVMDLPYLPRRFRFPFNAHHVIVLKREGDQYLVEDTLATEPKWCPVEDFTRARFPKGPFAPDGLMYAPWGRPPEAVPRSAVLAGLRESANRMLYAPAPFFGINAIRFLAKRIEKWSSGPRDERWLRLQLAQVVRMAEEVGSGGAGFRYLFAAFLDEASAFLGADILHDDSLAMVDCGDLWRAFSVVTAGACKKEAPISAEDGRRMREAMLACAEAETKVFKSLFAFVKSAK
jgi:hypothetical protein